MNLKKLPVQPPCELFPPSPVSLTGKLDVFGLFSYLIAHFSIHCILHPQIAVLSMVGA